MKSIWSCNGLRQGLSRKKLNLPATVLILLLTLSGCSVGGQAAAPLSGTLLITGSTALQPLVTKAAQLFMQQYAQVKITVQGGGSLSGVNDVTGTQPVAGDPLPAVKAAIGDSDVYADPVLYPDPNLTDHLVCVIPFAMVVNPDVTIPDLNITSSDLVKIFSTGTITNWSQVGGPNLAIKPIGRTATSGTRLTFRRYVIGGLDQLSSVPNIDSSQDVLKAVASTPGAISYLGLSVIDPTDPKLRELSLDGFAATMANITSGKYPDWGFEHMYTLGDDTPLLKAFLNFMFTSTIQDEAVKEQYIPIAAMQLPLASSDPVHSSAIALVGMSNEGDVRGWQ